MGEMDEKVDESQGQASERSPLREILEEELQKILAAHRKWVESEGKEGKKADLARANLRGAKLGEARGLTVYQVKQAKDWNLAFYTPSFLKKLGLPPDHNERVKEKLAELDKEKKAKDPKQ